MRVGSNGLQTKVLWQECCYLIFDKYSSLFNYIHSLIPNRWVEVPLSSLSRINVAYSQVKKDKTDSINCAKTTAAGENHLRLAATFYGLCTVYFLQYYTTTRWVSEMTALWQLIYVTLKAKHMKTLVPKHACCWISNGMWKGFQSNLLWCNWTVLIRWGVEQTGIHWTQ